MSSPGQIIPPKNVPSPVNAVISQWNAMWSKYDSATKAWQDENAKLRAQVNSLNAASRNATDALALIGTIDGALEESGEILLRMRELAVQSASDTNTGTDRSFIQDEINALNNELNRISSSTEFK